MKLYDRLKWYFPTKKIKLQKIKINTITIIDKNEKALLMDELYSFTALNFTIFISLG